ncbi:hypothetical protein RG836_12165 [Pseudomonas sp. SZMC_28357]|uniref:hypothetical protein n=1 Tax=Pseudomonas sp. SZMC_28357 TaxID=3074380 RepID=UPI002871B203|nr:hypothetical protein [Pseudomonas sp. SZMC_28357]MDR9752205.1 hypothetical protein [Pseudomonas sp. SZMC_28357]
MKTKLAITFALSLLASSAFALPASEQATPQVKDSHSAFSHTVAADGSDRTPGMIVADGANGNGRLKDKGLITEDGYDQTPQGQAVAENGNNRLKEKGLIVEDGYDQTPQGQAVAEGGGDRVIERNRAVS